MRVWFDCEFTAVEEPVLLSAGLIGEDGRECYVELLDDEVLARCSAFAGDEVVHQLGLVDGARVDSYSDLCGRLEAFLLALGEQVELLYDHKEYRELMQRALARAPRWGDLQKKVTWRNVAIETSSNRAQDVMEAAYRAAKCVGLARHHALVDARALRLAHLVGGQP